MMGCSNPNSNPELRDPVYKDLKSEETKIKKDLQEKEKALVELKTSYEEMPDNNFQKKLTRADIFKSQNEITKLRQMESFHRISAESRQIYARKEYLEYFKAGKESEWPPKESQVLYMKQKAAEKADKRWTRGMASVKPVDKKSEKKKSEH